MTDQGTTTSIPTPRGCVGCGASNPADAHFCSQCGAVMPPLPMNPPAPDGARALLQDAREHFTLGRWEEATLAAEAALTLDPDIAEAHFIAARAMLKQGMRGSAIKHAERAVELDPGNPQYQAAVAAALDDQARVSLRMPPPAIAASVVAAVVLLGIFTLALTHHGGERVATNPVTPTTAPEGPASPFTTRTGQNFPQPSHPAGTQYTRPRLSARAAPLEDTMGTGTGATTTGAAGTAGATGAAPATGLLNPNITPSPAGLSPAPVDTSALHQFAAPTTAAAPRASAPAARSATPRSATRTTQATPISEAPPAFTAEPSPLPPSNRLFGTSIPSGATAPATATDGTSAESTEAAPAPAPKPAATVSPQQAFVDRNYGSAVQGYLNRINNGEATGSNYQQLAWSYERVGDRQDAIAAYKSAIAAYQAQIQAGQDTEVATRGLRASQLSLRRLQGH